MAEYALLDENNVVLNIVHVDDLIDSNGEEYVCNNLHNMHGGIWKKYSSSLENNFRKNPASIGGTYDPEKDAFIYQQPHIDMVLNQESLKWEFPIPMPEDGMFYEWNSEIKNWSIIVEDE